MLIHFIIINFLAKTYFSNDSIPKFTIFLTIHYSNSPNFDLFIIFLLIFVPNLLIFKPKPKLLQKIFPKLVILY